MNSKHGKVVSYCENFSPIKAHNHLSIPHNHSHKTFSQSICQGSDIPQEVPTHKFA